jgi:hypothetical protein
MLRHAILEIFCTYKDATYMLIPATDLAAGLSALSRLLEDMKSESLNLNEADTRHRFIDRLIHECLGWDRTQTHLERHVNGDYSDYELGIPPQIVIEAKRAGKSFEIPSETNKSIVRSLGSLFSLCPNFRDAFKQAQKYCSDRGIQVGVISNSTQIIVFLGVRNDGIPPAEGKCLLFNGWEQIGKKL